MKKNGIKGIHLLLLAIVLTLISFFYSVTRGREYLYKFRMSRGFTLEQCQLTTGENETVIKIADKWMEGTNLCLRVEGVAPGVEFVEVEAGEEHHTERFIVDRLGIVTVNTFLGRYRGCEVVAVSVVIFLIALICYVVQQYRRSLGVSLYRYHNILLLGLLIFLSFFLLIAVTGIPGYGGISQTVGALLNASSTLSIVILPVAFITSILVTLSNIQLMIREGRKLTNMLGCFLGVFLCVMTLLPDRIDLMLISAQFIEFHNSGSWLAYLLIGAESIVYTGLAYLECLLIATIILAVRAARSVPSFDRDFILVLGCQINNDGTLTRLLQGRADRALEFAAMQKEHGKDITFVGSGGQGPNEVISEGEAIGNYLVSTGVAPERVLVENTSTDTVENFRNSVAVIRESGFEGEPKIAFSTTNYHVFRAGILARRQGLEAQGIGSSTKSYFWINAFIREFIATLYYERKIHFVILAVLVVMIAILTLLMRVHMAY